MIWLLKNPEAMSSLYSYLGYNPDEEEIVFANEALDALVEGGEVDFEDKIIIGLIDKPCQNQVIKDILNTSSPFTNLITQTFNSTEKVNLKFSNGSIPGGNAYTNPFYVGNSDNFIISIRFDNDYLDNATDLSIAAVVLHEVVHAYLMNLYIKGVLVSTNSDYNNLFNAYIAFYENKTDDTFSLLDDEIHNAMNDFISQMANSLYNYALSKNIPGVTADYCEQLSWGTMYGTELFEEMLTPQQQIDYGNIAATEQDNLANAKGSNCQ